MYSNVRSTNYQAKLIGRLVRVSVTLIQKIPSKYMNTALPKKTNVTIFTTAQHSLRCRFLGRTQQVLNSTLFIYADTTLTTIQPFLSREIHYTQLDFSSTDLMP